MNDNDDVTNLVSGVTMEGTTFTFGALCSSVSEMVIIHLITEYVTELVKKEYPPELHNDPLIFRKVFQERKKEIAEAVWLKYSEIYGATKAALRESLCS